MLTYSLLKKNNEDEYDILEYSKIEEYEPETENIETGKTFYKITLSEGYNVTDGEIININVRKEKQDVSFNIKEKCVKISDSSFYFKTDKFYKLYPLSINNIDDGKYLINFDYFHFFHEGENNTIYAYNQFNYNSETEYINELNIEYSSEKSLIINSYNYVLMNDIIKNLHYYTFIRRDFKFNDFDSLQILKLKYIYNINIPVRQTFNADLFKSEYVSTNFIEDEKNKSINRIVDMEKDIYYPVITGNSNTIFVEDIIFNFHFRKRNSEDWIANDSDFWNGTNIENGEPVIDENYIKYYPEDVLSKSDLYYYLNFTDSDIRYQKNKLKKSFVRLLFYDSDNQSNQNLLYTSTIFIDSGKSFGKYCRHLNDYPYVSVNDYNNEELTGIRVDREPCSELIKGLNYYDIDEYRLSSRVSVKDKFNNDSCSDGFYLYLFKENNSSFIGQNLYMKVEFNHAGYGRTIPFMYLVGDDNKTLSYQGVLDLWKSYKNDNGDIVGFDLNSYYKYSYIKLIYKYDKSLNRHVYFLKNEDEYNTDIDNSKLIINLFEAKLGSI